MDLGSTSVGASVVARAERKNTYSLRNWIETSGRKTRPARARRSRLHCSCLHERDARVYTFCGVVGFYVLVHDFDEFGYDVIAF